jgi:DNA-damage-inducible protein D
MEKDITKQHLSVFEQIREFDEYGIEFWSARNMAKVLEYSEYEHQSTDRRCQSRNRFL